MPLVLPVILLVLALMVVDFIRLRPDEVLRNVEKVEALSSEVEDVGQMEDAE